VIFVLRTEHHVIHCLVTYTDWWQPPTASVFQVGAARRGGASTDGLAAGLLDTLDDRTEIRRRVWHLREADRLLLFLWYVEQSPVDDIAIRLDISRRQCFRRRARAIQTIIDLGEQAA
jgi:DNA-directed RNA polymerase specialized sigma24 family protein